ncbi:MAG TPA: hypothetical protein DIT64_17185 [Verrucomicrobiales bacterium]|nr:hypothetical protein [Verrucomicrobiales bacterium]
MSETLQTTSIFLSYARADDEPFVRRLCDDLEARGFTVWFDRNNLRSRGLTFHHEIRDAITAHDRLILIVGPQAAKSEYVRQEWQFAWFDAEKVVTPILRKPRGTTPSNGDYQLIPDELKLLHCEDFRDDTRYAEHLEKLIASLSVPPPKLGQMIGVPSLPANYLSRTELLTDLRAAVRAGLDSTAPLGGTSQHQRLSGIIGRQRIGGMAGMGGIGKSVLACLLAHDRKIREAFPDGIVWVTLGTSPQIEELQRRVHRDLGGAGAFKTAHEGKTQIKQLLANMSVLLILDDAWRKADVEAFDVLGPTCRALITTRDAQLITSLGGTPHLIDLLNDDEALHLLATTIGKETAQLPPDASQLTKECGRLPLALALAGGMIASGMPWAKLLTAFKRHRLEFFVDDQRDNQHHDLLRMIEVSVQALTSGEQSRLVELGVFPGDQTVPETPIAMLWQHTGGLDDFDTSTLLTKLKQRSLVQLNKADKTPAESLGDTSLHDLVQDYCLARAKKELGGDAALHQKILEAYQGHCPGGWSNGPDQGYFLKNLPFHLVNAGRAEEARSLLAETGWIATKRLIFGVEAILSDIDLIVQSAADDGDWAWAQGAAVAGALTVQQVFQVPPKELIPIYARAGRGAHAVEMAQYIEDQYERANLLLEIAKAAEADQPKLAKTIRAQLWNTWKAGGTDIHGSDHVIVVHLAHADPSLLASHLSQCVDDRFRQILYHLLRNEPTVHTLLDLPVPILDNICIRLSAICGRLLEHEAFLLVGFASDISQVSERIDLEFDTNNPAHIEWKRTHYRDYPEWTCPRYRADLITILRSLLEGRNSRVSPNESIARAMKNIEIGPHGVGNHQIEIRALLAVDCVETLNVAIERSQTDEQNLNLLVEVCLGLVRIGRYDDALRGMREAARIGGQGKSDYSGRKEWSKLCQSEIGLIIGLAIRGITRLTPERGWTLSAEADLQSLARDDLRWIVLWELPNYDEVKKLSSHFEMPKSLKSLTLRAAHDLEGAYQAWDNNRIGHQSEAEVLKKFLLVARPVEGTLILRLLREELFPRLWPARQPTDITPLDVQVACSVAALNKQKAKVLLKEVRIGDCYEYDYAERRDRIAILPTMALAGDAEGALRLANHLDKNDAGFGAMAIAEIVRLSRAGLVRCDDYRVCSAFKWALREIQDCYSLQGVEEFLTRSWMWDNARVAMSIGRPLTPRSHKWRLKHTLAVIASKATNLWQEICDAMEQHLNDPTDRELVLCEASQWMPLEEAPVLEAIQNPAFAAIAWVRMARRATSAADRKEWRNRAERAASSWPGPEDKEALDVLWIFLEEAGADSSVSRELAGRILRQCIERAEHGYGYAPALLAASLPGLFSPDQHEQVTRLAKGWQDWMHTFKFAQPPHGCPYDDAQRIAGDHLVRLADVWWKTDPTHARVCINMALEHAKECRADRGRWDVQSAILRCWASHGNVEDWKQALACWRWGPTFLAAADTFVERWAALGNTAYPESQANAVHWARTVSANVLNAI